MVNICGCLVIGILAGVSERYNVLGPNTQLFLFTGLLGGFITFPSFGQETVSLLRRGCMGAAALYAGGSFVLGLGAVCLGFKIIAWLPRRC